MTTIYISNEIGIVLFNRLMIKALPDGVKEVLAFFGYTNKPCLYDLLTRAKGVRDWAEYLNNIPTDEISLMNCAEANVVYVTYAGVEIDMSDYHVMVWEE